jgi:SAUR family protein
MSSSTGHDGSRQRCSTDGNDDDEEEEAASGFTRVVWLRQMLHRWQSSASTATAKSSSASASGERANDDDPAGASTADRADNDAAGSGSGGERDPLLPASSADRPWAVEESFCYPDPDEEGGGDSDSPMTPMTPDAPAGVPRGCCPVYVGLVAPERRRFVVPTSYLGMPVFRRLLEKAEEEFEFHYGSGGVTIPCDTEAFKYILLVMERHRQGLVDDGTHAGTPHARVQQRCQTNHERTDGLGPGGLWVDLARPVSLIHFSLLLFSQKGTPRRTTTEEGSSGVSVDRRRWRLKNQDEATMAASSGAEGGAICGKAITLHGMQEMVGEKNKEKVTRSSERPCFGWARTHEVTMAWVLANTYELQQHCSVCHPYCKSVTARASEPRARNP